jgi:RNA polymerase sigma-70 factor (ECF subfamily)
MKNETKFRELHEKYAKFAYRKACKMLKRPQDTEDALQEAWIRVYKNIDKLDLDSGVRTRAYIGRIVTNECLRILNKNNSSKSDVKLPDEWFNSIEDISASPEAEAIAKESMEGLMAVINSLSEMDRHIFLLKHLDEMKNKEIADMLGLDAKYVGARLARIAKKLMKKEELKDLVENDEG